MRLQETKNSASWPFTLEAKVQWQSSYMAILFDPSFDQSNNSQMKFRLNSNRNPNYDLLVWNDLKLPIWQGKVVGTYSWTHKVDGSILRGGLSHSINLHLYLDVSPWCVISDKLNRLHGLCHVILHCQKIKIKKRTMIFKLSDIFIKNWKIYYNRSLAAQSHGLSTWRAIVWVTLKNEVVCVKK